MSYSASLVLSSALNHALSAWLHVHHWIAFVVSLFAVGSTRVLVRAT